MRTICSHFLAITLAFTASEAHSVIYKCVPPYVGGSGQYYSFVETPEAIAEAWYCKDAVKPIFTFVRLKNHIPSPTCAATVVAATTMVAASAAASRDITLIANSIVGVCESIPAVGTADRTIFDAVSKTVIDQVQAKWLIDNPPNTVIYRTPSSASASMTVYKVVGNKLGAIVPSKLAPKGVIAQCTVLKVTPPVFGSPTYCAFPGGASDEVTYVLKVSQ